jgi:hypothetical protein
MDSTAIVKLTNLTESVNFKFIYASNILLTYSSLERSTTMRFNLHSLHLLQEHGINSINVNTTTKATVYVNKYNQALSLMSIQHRL